MANQLIIPIALWGDIAPTHCISCIHITSDHKTLVTGCHDGQICLWDIEWIQEEVSITPRCMLFGHSCTVMCLADGDLNNHNIISSSENGEMCLWSVEDGRCLETSKSHYTHTNIQNFQVSESECRLFCIGYYSEILVIDPQTFDIHYRLTSSVDPDWVSSMHVLQPKSTNIVVIGLTVSGIVRIWTLVDNVGRSRNPIYDNDSKSINCYKSVRLISNPHSIRLVLIVCPDQWQVFDACDFTPLCTGRIPSNEHWTGGNFFCAGHVIVWTDFGQCYIYKIPTTKQMSSDGTSWPKLCATLIKPDESRLLCPPTMNLATMNNFYVVIRGDSSGQVTLWSFQPTDIEQHSQQSTQSINLASIEIKHKFKNSLQKAWESMRPPPCGILGDTTHKITASVYLPSQGRLVCGRENGSIIVSSATRIAMMCLLSGRHQSSDDWSQHQLFSGHTGRINCLLYPHNVHPRYDSNYLLSGGVDFCVCLWDLQAGLLLHKFCVHAGEITQFLVPPIECSSRVLSSICSVASDHSVSLLNLKEKKCILFASRQLFPVATIKWKPSEDSMVVGCVDNSAYVWRMETGHLLKVLHGVHAEETLASCDGVALAKENLSNPALELFKGLRQRNLATIKSAAARGLHQLATNQQQARDVIDFSPRFRSHFLSIQGLRTNPKDQDSHVMFFDVEALIVQLLHEEYSRMSPNTLESNGLTNTMEYQRYMQTCNPETHRFSGLLTKVKDTAEVAAQRIQATADVGIKNVTSELEKLNQLYKKGFASDNDSKKEYQNELLKRPSDMPCCSTNLMMEVVQILLSLLHAWGLDAELDKICDSKLGLLRPMRPVCFGLISKSRFMAMLLPCYVQRLDMRRSRRKHQLQGSLQSQNSADLPPMRVEQERARRFMSRFHWELSTAVTTTHLLAIISLANTLMSMNSVSFIRDQQVNDDDDDDVDEVDAPSNDVDETLGDNNDKSGRQQSSRPISRTSSLLASKEIASDMSASTVTGSTLDQEGSSMGDSRSQNQENQSSGSVATSSNQQQIKQGWSVLAALHCVLLPELVRSSNFKKPLVDILARRWQDRCLEVREAARALLLAELRRIGSKGRKQVVEEWAPFLPTYNDKSSPNAHFTQTNFHSIPSSSGVSSQLSASSTNQSLSSSASNVAGSAQASSGANQLGTSPAMISSSSTTDASLNGQNVTPTTSYVPSEVNDSAQSLGEPDEELDPADDAMFETSKRTPSSVECRRKEATAIVLLGVVGAEYGQEIEQTKPRRPPPPATSDSATTNDAGSTTGSDTHSAAYTTKPRQAPVEGFGGSNYSLAHHTGQALSYLLLAPPVPSLPAHTSLRRTAVDLIGRGFTVWEPYLDVAKVLLGLLDLCCETEKLAPSMSFGLPLTPASDSCRTSRHAISLIAAARPALFITTLAREVARFNTKQRNAHSLNVSMMNQTVLGRSRPEILRNIETLMDKMQVQVASLIVETMDITLHCLDHAQLKNRGLGEVFPAITRFHMVSYCPATRRIAVGTMTGSLTIYEIRGQSKSQVIQAHTTAITACSFSPDGKYLASYSVGDNRLCFWLTASGLFGLGNSRTRCVATIDTPPVPKDLISKSADSLRLARLIWVASKVVILMFIDGRELRYQVA